MNNMHHRILMIAPLCYPPAGAESIVTSKLVLAMIDAGWDVKMLSQSKSNHFYPVSDKDDWKPLRAVVCDISSISEKGFMAHILGSKLTNKLGILIWIIKTIFKSIIILKKGKYETLISRAAPQYGHLPALIVRCITGIPWIANWSDPMPPQKASPPYGKGFNAKTPFYLNIYYRLVFRCADWHTFPCERLMQYYCKIAPELKSKSSVIPHIALSKFCIQRDQEKNVFSLCHTGSTVLRDPSVFFEGLRLFLKEYRPSKPIKVTFIGNSIDHINRQVREFGLSDIVFIEAPKTYEETQLLAASASVLLVIEASCDEGIFFPSKFVDFIQTGRPILAISPRIGTLSDILNKNGGGIAVDNRLPNEISHALGKLYMSWETKTLTNNFGSQKLLNYFCEKPVVSKYSNLILQLTGKRSPHLECY
jgi:hypothetical protein